MKRTLYSEFHGFIGREITGISLDGVLYSEERLREAMRNCIPAGHIVIEQSEIGNGLVSQTVTRPDGSEYERVVDADEAYGPHGSEA